ncbi:MAG: ATP-binding cassette domain-containing protein [Dehalococcoidia bacterium]|nr:ATP-binding cassette domain-containing protein [Dehalococcoidia bacterium]
MVTATATAAPLLSVQGLTTIHGEAPCAACVALTGPEADRNQCPECGSIVACAGVSFDVWPGEVLGIVGESGSGKSTVLQCLYQDLQPAVGAAYFGGFAEGQRSIWDADRRERRELRTQSIGMVYQNPRQGLNLMVTAGGNIAERLLDANWRRVGDIREKASDYLQRTEVPLPRMDDFPAFFSGGMQQRVQIAKALANSPQLVLLDELTTGLDVSVQAGVLDLVRDIQRDYGLTAVIVSHDLGVIRLLADRTLVMKQGRVVESGLTDQILEDPQHPYTQLLVNCAT